MQLPLVIPLRPSRLLLDIVIAAHLGASAVVWPLSLPDSATIGLLAGIVLSLVMAVLRIRRCPYEALRLGRGGELELEQKIGTGDTALVQSQTVVLPGLIVLRLRVGGRSLVLPLLPDTTGTEAHRQLRLWLRWRCDAA